MKIKSIKINSLDKPKEFLDITVDKYHNFVIGKDAKIVTHNSSLNSAIIGMAQSFKNSLPLLDGIGQFGSLRSPEAGAPRYVSTRLNSNFRLLYKDFELLENQIEEGIEIEPKFFLPIIPTVLLNGTSGIAVGFSTNILNRHPNDLIECCLKVLNNKNFEEPFPWWSEFNGEVKKIEGQNSSFIISGEYEIVNSTTVKITELPPSMTYEKFQLHLNNLEERGIIQSYDKNKKDGKINYIIKFSRSELSSRIEKSQLESLLKINETETENLTCLDENGKLIIFKSITDLINYFVKFRLSYYDKRKEYILNELKKQHLILSNRAKFIKSIIDGKLKINNRPKADIIFDMEKLKFQKYNDSFDFFLNMPIHSVTKEKYEELIKEIGNNEAESSRISAIKPIDMYREDLKELKNKITK